jgi:hypothetical protein
MDKRELATIIADQESHSLGYDSGELQAERAKALNYYNSKPLGNEVEGQSQVISSDVFDVVEGMLPPLVKIFASTNTAVEFEPVGPEDEQTAKQATAACNHVFYKQNNGVLILYTWFKDALLQKNGLVKWYYEDKSEVQTHEYEGMTEQEFQTLVVSDEVEVLQHTAYDDPAVPVEMTEAILASGAMIPQLHDVKVRVTKKYGKVCIDPIPPEEFLVSRDHNSIDLESCDFCGHRTKKTISYLKEMGFSDEELKDIAEGTDSINDEEALARNQFAEETIQTDPADPSMREVWVTEGYIRVDYDGDGIAELIRFIKAGNKVLEHEETDEICIAAITPIVMPHRFMGKSMADVTLDFQEINSVLWRQGLNNLYLTNNPRHTVLEHQANLDDLLTSRPGGVVRIKTPDAVTPLITPFVAQHIFPMLEYNEARKENRTSVSRYNQGTDGDSLNKTAHGVQLIQNASMQRAELIARMFAETGVKRLFRGIKRTLYKSGLRKLSIRLNNEYVDVDPREWEADWDMTVNVGLGTGNKDQQLVHLNQIFQIQGMLAQLGKGYMVKDENLYSTVSKIAENSGFKHVEAFFTPPQSVPDEEKKQPPPPEMLKLQQEGQLDAAKLQSSEKQKMADLSVTKTIEEMKAGIAKYVAELEVASKERIAVMEIQSKERLEERRIQAEAQFRVFEANNQADMKTAEITHQQTVKGAELSQAERVKAAELAQQRELAEKQLASQEKVADKKKPTKKAET